MNELIKRLSKLFKNKTVKCIKHNWNDDINIYEYLKYLHFNIKVWQLIHYCKPLTFTQGGNDNFIWERWLNTFSNTV